MKEYYLSEKMIRYIASTDGKYKVNEGVLKLNRTIACTKTTREGNTRADASDYICRELPDDCEIGYDYRKIQQEPTKLRIRKLTPKECFRLQGVRDEDYEKVARNQSKGSLYHLAGDSICVDVLMAIFKEML